MASTSSARFLVPAPSHSAEICIAEMSAAQINSAKTDSVGTDPIKTDSNEITLTDAPRENSAEDLKCINISSHVNLPKTLKKFCLIGKVVVITGGARGLGKNIAEAMCEVGCTAIAILDILKDGKEHANEMSMKYGTRVEHYPVNVTCEKAVHNAMIEIYEKLGGLDVLICSAGIADSNMPAETYNTDRFRHLININLTGSFLCAQAAGKIMINNFKNSEQSGHIGGKPKGNIIFLASMSGSIVNWPQEQCAYNASKAGVKHLGASLAAEWAKYNIRVNSISPGYMDTVLNQVKELDDLKAKWCSRTPMERLGIEDELNNLAVFLASDASSFMTGSDCIIDGGYCCW